MTSSRSAAGLILVLLLAANGPLVAQKAAITHESLWMMKRVGAPSPSPDGKWVVFSVVEPSYDEKEEVSDLWIVSADGGEPRRLTSSKSPESSVAWSPDSSRIAFASKRDADEVSQIYLLGVNEPGEAVRISHLPTPPRGLQWSPDGTLLLFQASVYPGAVDEPSNRKAVDEKKNAKSKVRIYESFPVRRWDRWLDQTQTHLFVISAQPHATSRDLLAGTDLIRSRGFSGAGGSGASDNLQAVWSPDGRSVVFVATTDRDAAAYSSISTHLYLTGVDGGEPRRLTSGTVGYSSPRFRPDGAAICFSVDQGYGKIYALDRLGCAPWPSAEVSKSVRIITPRFDRSASDFAFGSDGKTIYFTAEDAGLVKLYAVPSAGGSVDQVLDQSNGVYGALDVPQRRQGTVLFATWGDATHPDEIVRIDPVKKKQTFLTSFTADDAARIDWLPLRHFWFEGTSGRKIHNMIALPAGFDEGKKYPLVVLIHGGAHSSWHDDISLRWDYHLLAKGKYVLLMTDYRGSTGYGEQFSLDILHDPLKGPASDINEAVDEAVKRFAFVDGTKICAAGASYGGHLVNWLEATNDGRYRCLVGHAGLSSLETQWGTSDGIYHRELQIGGPPWDGNPIWNEQSPITHAKNFRTPILLSVGENDFRVPLNNTLQMWSVLQRMRVPSRLLVWPDENHWILKPENSKVFYGELDRWLDQYLH